MNVVFGRSSIKRICNYYSSNDFLALNPKNHFEEMRFKVQIELNCLNWMIPK